jgi:hypothetical protein
MILVKILEMAISPVFFWVSCCKICAIHLRATKGAKASSHCARTIRVKVLPRSFHQILGSFGLMPTYKLPTVLDN